MKCSTENKSIGWLYANQRKLNFNPTYQREAGAWSLARKTLFVDSLFNNFDIPKIYFHEYPEGQPFDHAVIDGKQRISTLVEFMDSKFCLAEDFEYSAIDLDKQDAPAKNQFFKDLSPSAQQHLRDVQLAVTIVRKADEEEIESLFSRLNDGEPLNSAEFRNAFGGTIVRLIRDVAERDFFTKYVGYTNKRYAFRETACRLLYLEYSMMQKHGTPDLKKQNLDSFVKSEKGMSDSDASKLLKRLDSNLAFIQKCFTPKSKELSKQSFPQVYYLWLSEMKLSYGHPELAVRLQGFIEKFAADRIANNSIEDEEARDVSLSEFSYLSSQGTSTAASMNRRAQILTRRFLEAFPDTVRLDEKRLFSVDEKFVIWLRANKKCQSCSTDIESFMDFDADHIAKFAHGGRTTLENAQALCASCNRSKG